MGAVEKVVNEVPKTESNLQSVAEAVVVKGVVKKAGSMADTSEASIEQIRWWIQNAMMKSVEGNVNGSYKKLNDWHKEIRKSPSLPVSEERAMPNLKTGRIWNKGGAKRNLINHIYNEEELRAAQYIWNNPEKLKFVRNSPLGEVKDLSLPTDVANIENKKARFVTSYNQYEFILNSETWLVKMEVINDSREQFYHIVKKK